jgi:hypothetical protein
MVDAPCHKAANFLVGEDQVMRVVDADAKLLARPFHQLDEVSVPKVHVGKLTALTSAFHPRQTLAPAKSTSFT